MSAAQGGPLMSPRLTRRLSIASCRRLAEDLLVASGCRPEVAIEAADVFVEAEMQGNWIQGIHYLHSQVKSLRLGRIDPDGRPRLVREGSAFAHLVGDRGLGQLAGNAACEAASRKARHAGAAVVGVTDSSDIFMLSYYAERLTRAGLIGIVMINSPPTVHPIGGVERVLGTNPFAFGFPLAGGPPFLFDTAASAELSARIRLAAEYGQRLGEGAAIDSTGSPTTHPLAAMAGAVSPFAGEAGYGLALMVAFLSGCLLGNAVGKAQAAWLDATLPRAPPKGHLYMAIDPDAFVGADAFRAAARAWLGGIIGGQASASSARIRFPGERAFARRQEALARGWVMIDQSVWEKTVALAAELGVEVGA
jgi:LDH2 family malate/lactate/ureidoglycolate dehydrogenase